MTPLPAFEDEGKNAEERADATRGESIPIAAEIGDSGLLLLPPPSPAPPAASTSRRCLYRPLSTVSASSRPSAFGPPPPATSPSARSSTDLQLAGMMHPSGPPLPTLPPPNPRPYETSVSADAVSSVSWSREFSFVWYVPRV